MRISDWSSDVCSSDLIVKIAAGQPRLEAGAERCREGKLAAEHVAVARDRGFVDDEPETARIDARLAEIGAICHRNALRRYVAVPQHVGALELLGELARMGRQDAIGVTDPCLVARHLRSEARRVGKKCYSTCRSRWSPYHSKKKK